MRDYECDERDQSYDVCDTFNGPNHIFDGLVLDRLLSWAYPGLVSGEVEF